MFEWDDDNVGHIAEHGVTPEEAEAAMLDRHKVPAQSYSTTSERRWAIVGSTDGRRLLFVVFTRRGRLVRVLSARDASASERRRYRR